MNILNVSSRASGLEMRSPFLDRAVVEFVMGLPTVFLMQGRQKELLRMAMADVLPPSFQSRSFFAVAGPALRAGLAEEARRIQGLLTNSLSADYGIATRRYISKRLEELDRGVTGASLGPLKRIVACEIFLRKGLHATSRTST
jgi:asparagine synthetase B (glutamine-hydrolysing)